MKGEYVTWGMAKRWLVVLVLVLVLTTLPIANVLPGWTIFMGKAYAATSANVSVNATPAYISISNAPAAYNFGVVAAGGTANTTNGYFTITNSSSVNIDILIQCNGWSSAGSAWTYGDPLEDTGNLDASSADGGVGGSGGAGLFDVSIPNGSTALLCDNVTSVTSPTWELQLDIPTAFTNSDLQQTTVTVSATQE